MRRPDLFGWLPAAFPWPLLSFGPPRARHVGSAALLALLLVSRLALLADGPWEQDEALLAAGVAHFDLTQHTPLPPGFPLWVFIGRLVRIFGRVADPLVALQVASSLLSVAGVWALAGLWQRLLGRSLATVAAVAAAFIPGVWFHAPRAFSGTPAAAFAIVAFAIWLGAGRRGFEAGAVAITCAALVRPPLAPFFAAALLLATWAVRREPRRIARGALASLAVAFVVLTPLVHEAGGLQVFIDSASAHASDHYSLLGTEPWNLQRLGFARGLGGALPALVFLALAALGWLSWRVRLGAAWWFGGALGAWLVYLILFLHNRTYPRYWVLVWLLLAGPAVGGLVRLLRRDRLVAVVTTAAAAAGAAWAWPAISHIHGEPLPVVAALRALTIEPHAGQGVLVFDDSLFSFHALAYRQGWLPMPAQRESEAAQPDPQYGGHDLWFLTERTGAYVSGPSASVRQFACTSERVRTLSQERFLEARLAQNPVLVVDGGAIPEHEGTRRFVWCGARSRFVVPPVSGGGDVVLAAAVHPALDGSEMVARVAGIETLRTRLAAGERLIRIPIPERPELFTDARVLPLEITMERELRPEGDVRALAWRVFAASVDAPPRSPRYSCFPERDSLLAATAEARGFHSPEMLGDPPRPAAWSGARSELDLPLGPGSVTLELLAARPTPSEVVLALGPNRTTASIASGDVVIVALPVPPGMHRGTLEMRSSVFVPGGGDQRELGVAVGRISFRPARD